MMMYSQILLGRINVALIVPDCPKIASFDILQI